MRVLGIVTARGGSKGVPRKNIRDLAGKPLLAWTAEAALSASRLARVVLSTDDDEIAEVGRRHGLDVPFMRPADLALDTTPSLPVLQHVVATLEAAGDRYDATCLLQPTNPLRRPGTIDACIELLDSTGSDSVVTVLPVPDEYNPHWVFFRAPDGSLTSAMPGPLIPRRQDLPRAFHREGQVYVTRRNVLMEQNTLYGGRLCGYPIDADWTANIDTLDDWARAEALLARR
jgi:CMP-N-acetylneuraminic acid synthetase